jgi:hypothetical protein
MERLTSFLGDFLSFLLLPATLFGAGGALVQSGHKGKTVKQTVFAVVGGVIVTSALSPLVIAYVPQEAAHPGLYFLVGWGGLEFVDRVYQAVMGAIERRIQRKIGDE